MSLRNTFIVGAKRTPFGTFGGALKSFTASDLGAHAATAALAQSGVSPDAVDSVVCGNVAQTDPSGAYIARHVGLRAGVPLEKPALTVNRLCGSGFQAVVTGTQEIRLGEASIVLTAGAESMSQAPYTVQGPALRWGTTLGKNLVLEDALWAMLQDRISGTPLPMGCTAENLAKSHGISREQADAFALLSQQRFAKGQESGAFDQEIAPMELQSRKGPQQFSVDEHPRPQTTLESLARLPTIFAKDGTVNAGNASGICDGAGAIVLAAEDAVEKHGLSPLARVVDWGIAGVDPTVMGIGPVPAIRQLLAKTNLKVDDIDLFEINEAFASQFLACQKDLGLSMDNTNINGGAIAVGHPTGASGSRILAHLTYQLIKHNKKRAIGAACIGGGQGIAVLLERV